MLHLCTPDCSHDPSLQRVPRDARQRPLTIDFHCHILSREAEVLVAGEPRKRGERAAQLQLTGESSVLHNEQVSVPAAMRRMTTIEERLADMDAMGVDMQVLSPSPTQYYYWTTDELAESVVLMQNENIATHCGRYPSRLRGLGTVALQNPALAALQLRHCVKELGLAGVEISSACNGVELSHDSLLPFWREVEALDCIVFLHPLGTSLGERVNTHYLANIIGQPLETTIALSKMIFSGFFDRHPRLKLIAAHGGGYLPAYSGRSDHGHHVRPESAQTKLLPSQYLRRIWFDTLVYEPSALATLAEFVGVSQLVVGTDYPYDMGAYDVHALLEATPSLSDDERAQILGRNAAWLLGITST